MIWISMYVPTTDGCATQYRSGTVYKRLSALAAVSHSVVIQILIQAPGHGKGENTCVIDSSMYHNPHRLFCFHHFYSIGIVDWVNGVTKSKLTIASASEIRQADETADVKKMSAATMIDGVLNSPAHECKRWLDLDKLWC